MDDEKRQACESHKLSIICLGVADMLLAGDAETDSVATDCLAPRTSKNLSQVLHGDICDRGPLLARASLTVRVFPPDFPRCPKCLNLWDMSASKARVGLQPLHARPVI